MRFEAHWETTASPDKVWEVLADGWRYPGWVVGASRMRAVDPAWPAPGARIHIRSDCGRSSSTTTPRFSRRIRGKSLTLLARAKAFGRARIEIQVRPDGVGSVIEMGEHLASPPMSWFPQSVVELAAGAAQTGSASGGWYCSRRAPPIRATDRPHRGSGDRMTEKADAIVVGAGPNGLVAAITLADRGWDVLVLEAEPTPGGAVRSGDLHPGYRYDRFSAFYPLSAVSPACRRADLDRYGLSGVELPSRWPIRWTPRTRTRPPSLPRPRTPQQHWSGSAAATGNGGSSCTGRGERIRSPWDTLFGPFPH